MGARQFERPNTERIPEPMQVYKFWWTAHKGVTEEQKGRNEAIDIGYHALLERLKRYYASLENPMDKLVLEINRYQDRTSITVMYTFITPHCYYQLQCIGKEYQVSYYIDEGIHFDAISNLRKGLLLPDHLVDRKFTKPFADYYQGAIKCRSQHLLQL